MDGRSQLGTVKVWADAIRWELLWADAKGRNKFVDGRNALFFYKREYHLASNMAQCHVWEFCANEDVYDQTTLQAKLHKIAKKFTYQLEEGEKNGYRHWQGRMSKFVEDQAQSRADDADGRYGVSNTKLLGADNECGAQESSMLHSQRGHSDRGTLQTE
jgi:hypothetical protein